jgi:phenylacetate-CoA ligase
MRRTFDAVRFAAGELARGSSARARARARERKLGDLLEHAARHVPFYRDLFQRAGIPASDLRDPRVLEHVPVSSKDVFRAAGDALLSELSPKRTLRAELTSGSSGQPFATYFDSAYAVTRNLRFLRALFAAGYRPGMKLMLITEHPSGGVKRFARWHYCGLDAPVEQQAEMLRALRPDVVYGALTALRMLADGLAASSRPVPAARRVVSTAEMLDAPSRARLERAFGAPVADFYGMTEAGVIAWQRDRDMPYAIADDSVLVEQVPVQGFTDRSQLVVTNLDLLTMPLIRYATGDIGHFSSEGALVRIEGRSVDCVVLPHGRVSPFQLTMALQDVRGMERFRIRQTARDRVELEVQTNAQAPARVAAEAADRLARALGPQVHVESRVVASFPIGASGKFRVVESLVGD